MPEQTDSLAIDPVVGALLAGGASRRMGLDKSALTLGGHTLAGRAAARLEQVAQLRVQVGGGNPPPGWSLLRDAWPDAGPAAGIATALLHFPGATIVASAVDLPFATVELLRETLRRLPGRDACAPRHEGRWQPLAAAYSPRLLPLLCERLDRGERSLQRLLDVADVAVIAGEDLRRFGDPDRLLFNVNTPADLEQARVWDEAEQAEG